MRYRDSHNNSGSKSKQSNTIVLHNFKTKEEDVMPTVTTFLGAISNRRAINARLIALIAGLRPERRFAPLA